MQRPGAGATRPPGFLVRCPTDWVVPTAVVCTEGQVKTAQALIAEDGKCCRLTYEAGVRKHRTMKQQSERGE